MVAPKLRISFSRALQCSGKAWSGFTTNEFWDLDWCLWDEFFTTWHILLNGSNSQPSVWLGLWSLNFDRNLAISIGWHKDFCGSTIFNVTPFSRAKFLCWSHLIEEQGYAPLLNQPTSHPPELEGGVFYDGLSLYHPEWILRVRDFQRTSRSRIGPQFWLKTHPFWSPTVSNPSVRIYQWCIAELFRTM